MLFLPIIATSGISTSVLIALGVVAFVLLVNMWRGWSAGAPRMVVEIIGIAAAYAVGWLFNPVLGSLLKPVLQAPDVVLNAMGGVLGAGATYLTIAIGGRLLLKSTKDQEGPVKVLFGLSGALIGLVVGVVMVLFLAVAVRILGSIAELDAPSKPATSGPLASGSPSAISPASSATPAPLPKNPVLASVVEIKRSMEEGPIGVVVEAVDPVPEQVYAIFRKLGRVVQRADRIDRFLSFPGVRELASNQKLTALLQDPEIRTLVEERRYAEMLRNEQVIQVANDPELAGKLKTFPLEKALDYALAGG